jgi:hypothetical protein
VSRERSGNPARAGGFLWHSGRVRWTSRLSLPQRVVVVVAVGVGCTAVGLYLTARSRLAAGGWYAYASGPFAGSGTVWSKGTILTGWELLLIWLALTAGWALTSLWVLRPPTAERLGPSA